MKNELDKGLLIFATIIIGLVLLAVITYIRITDNEDDLPTLKAYPISVQMQDFEPSPTAPKEIIKIANIDEEPKAPILSDDDLMAIVVMCEAENQEMIGKVAVATTILNRCDYYGETVETVVKKPNQYAFDANKKPSEDCYIAVKIAKRERQLFPDTMMWFLPNDWSQYGEHYLPIQDHYFSYLKEVEQ